MKILLGTKNKHKIIELCNIFEEFNHKYDLNIELVSLNDFEDVVEPVEDGNTFEENALIKAKYYYEKFNIPTLTDDSGIVAKALGNLPGIYSARYATDNGNNSPSVANRRKLLKDMEGKTSRDAYYYCAICIYSDNLYIMESAKMEGYLLEEEIGTYGFGYDPIFFSADLNQPMGLVEEEIKNKISHRGKALVKTLEKLTKIVKK